MRRNARIAGLVSYLNESGQRVAIPMGPCVVVEPEDFVGVHLVIWVEAGEEKTAQLSLLEFSQYTKSGELKLLK